MKLVLSCSLGVESIARKEIEMLGYTVLEGRDRVIIFQGDEEAIVKVNLWSRVGNKVYILLAQEKNTLSFDALYDTIYSLSWEKYIVENPIIVNAKTLNSTLNSTPSIQKIVKKAIADKLAGKGNFLREDFGLPERNIEIALIRDELLVMLDTSGEGLHKRGYRKSTVEAPLKENLAASLVLLSGWKFREPFYDIFCGSGTIAIEAAMIAQNRAPGLLRNFAYENFPGFPSNLKTQALEEARAKLYTGKYTIIASDIDDENILVAKQNAKNAGVDPLIDFSQADAFSYLGKPLHGTLVSNPPYGDRLKSDDMYGLYEKIRELFAKNGNLGGGIITNYEFDEKERNMWKRRKLFNGGKEVTFFKKQFPNSFVGGHKE